MKFLFDFFPILLFFGVFKAADLNKQGALTLVTTYLSGIVAGGAIQADQAPVMIATVVVTQVPLRLMSMVVSHSSSLRCARPDGPGRPRAHRQPAPACAGTAARYPRQPCARAVAPAAG